MIITLTVKNLSSMVCLFFLVKGKRLNVNTIELSSLPLGVLRKAQHALAHVKTVSDSDENDSSSEDASGSEAGTRTIDLKGKQKEKPEWSLKPRKDLAKRANKHA